MENECSNKQRAVRLTQSSITGLRHQTHLVKRDIERIQDQGADVGQKKLEVDRKTITDEERLTELSKTLDHREILVRTTEQNLVRLQDKNFKSTQQNVDLKAELEALVFSIRGNNMYLTSLHRQLKQKQNLAHNQAQQIYELQYKITQLNRRISFMEGAQSGLAEKSSDDVKILQAKRGNCQKEIMLMRTRLYKQEEFIKNLKKKLDRNEVEREKNEIALAEIMLYLHTTQQCLERVKVRKMVSLYLIILYSLSDVPRYSVSLTIFEALCNEIHNILCTETGQRIVESNPQKPLSCTMFWPGAAVVRFARIKLQSTWFVNIQSTSFR